ncbi:hypothetical protein TraAM80_07423 [Trypanosoma rangeli]|uniref:SAC3/GANP/THP3 conserved domain-containing protein n=1 Tax=Trypanosoma rangeli TaxID=5698 RepID=A0A3R7N5W4_TRYRA|nr:uncharacterized protein TraAM80_07423 [Trypanosoma rangeli]RNF00742.1 hypothetical protein TraAM80_07423 [Trypanosoma rangeli]|eukprot:RNF00742.1 hypothetical protein TraAM80_07423 [Trypanosoma rangeli]
MLQDELGVREALSAMPFAAFCEFRVDEPPRRGCLAALCGSSETSQRPAPPSFELHYKSRHPQLPTAVEAYGRSAAGVVVEPSHLRNPLALEKTMHFLVHHYLRDPHTPAVFLAPFEVWRYLWDRMRQVRTNWVPQLPPVGTQSLSSHDYADGVLPGSVRESIRRLKWLEFTVAALAVGGANLCRSVQGCRRYMAEKQNFLESIAQCFSDLVLSYRAEQRLRNSEMFSAVLLFYGLAQLTKVENRAGFCQVIEVQVGDDAAPTHLFEPPSRSVDFGSVYRELAYLPQMARTRHVRAVLRLIHSWCQREWFGFFHLCRSEPLTVLQRAMVFHSFSYARFRAVVDLVTANTVVYGKARLRGEMAIAELADLLLMEEAHCVELLETMGLGGQISEDRSILRVARADSSPYTTQEAIYRHLEDTGGKPRLCLPTLPSFFGFTVWREAFDLFPDAFGDAPLATHGDLCIMTCPVNLMRLLEPYCPTYNNDVAAVELTDAGNEWFTGVQAARERMLAWYALHMSSRGPRYTNNDEDEEVAEFTGGDVVARGGRSRGLSQELLKSAVEAMDQESQSTHSSVFNGSLGGDHDANDGSRSSSNNNADVVEGEQGEVPGAAESAKREARERAEEEEEEDEAVRAAKVLLLSLRNDAMYAKIQKELQAKTREDARRADAAAPLSESCDSHPQNTAYDVNEDNKNNSGDTNTEATVGTMLNAEPMPHTPPTAEPWLSLPPPPFKVCVSPLPSEHPGKMSPSLHPTVETPTSCSAAGTEVPLLQEGVDWSGVAPVEETEPTAPQPPFPFFPARVSDMTEGDVRAPLEPHGGRKEESRAKRPREEAVPCHGILPSSKPPGFFSVRPPREEAEVEVEVKRGQQLRSCHLDGASSVYVSSVESREVLLPFEKEEERRQLRGAESDAVTQPPRQRACVEGVAQETLHELQGVRKVTFVAASPGPAKVPGQPTSKLTGVKPRRLSYRDTIRTSLQRQRGTSREFVGRVSASPLSRLVQQQRQQTEEASLRFSSQLGAPAVAGGASEPRWMHAFMNYLLGFFAASYDDATACRFLSEVICGDPEAQARGVAGWLCRGFTPSMVALRAAPPQLDVVGKPDVPMLQLTSTVVVFGGAMRDEGTDETSWFSGRRTVPRASLLESTCASACTSSVAAEEALCALSTIRPLSLGRWVAAMLLPREEAVSLLTRGALYSVGHKGGAAAEDDDSDDAVSADTRNGGELLSLWEQLHAVRMSTAPRLTPAAEWSRQSSSRTTGTLAEAAAWSRPRRHLTTLQTRLALYGIDYRDAPQLRCVAGEKARSASTPWPEEHITAVITLDTSRGVEYEAGLYTLQLLIRQAVEHQTMFLAGVLIILYASSTEEELRLQQSVEELFWTTWRQSAQRTTAAAAERIEASKEVEAGRSAYQRTIRRSLSAVKPKLQTASPTRNPNVRQPHDHSNGRARTMQNAIRGFFMRGDAKEAATHCTTTADDAVAFDTTQSYAPSPVLVVQPIRTTLESGTGRGRTGQDACGGGCVTGGEFAANNAELLRTALLQSVNSLLHGYDAKWREFLRENDMGARETVLRVS